MTQYTLNCSGPSLIVPLVPVAPPNINPWALFSSILLYWLLPRHLNLPATPRTLTTTNPQHRTHIHTSHSSQTLHDIVKQIVADIVQQVFDVLFGVIYNTTEPSTYPKLKHSLSLSIPLSVFPIYDFTFPL